MSKTFKLTMVLLLVLFSILTVGCNRNLRSNPYYNNNNPYGYGNGYNPYNPYLSPADQYRLKALEIEEQRIKQESQQEMLNQALVMGIVKQSIETGGSLLGSIVTAATSGDGKDKKEDKTKKQTTYKTDEEGDKHDESGSKDTEDFTVSLEEDCDPVVAEAVRQAALEPFDQIENQ